MKTIDKMPTAEKISLRKSTEEVLEKYRVNKHLAFEERESRPTTNYEPRYHGHTNRTSDEAATVAVHNVDGQTARKAYCDLIEQAVNRLPDKEKLLITERYMNQSSEYITDSTVYNFRIGPPISSFSYYKIKNRAMVKLAMMLGLDKRDADEHY